MDPKPAHIVLYSLGWTGDHAAGGEEATSLLHCIVEINGHLVAGASGAKIEAAGGDFTQATIYVNPASIRQVACTPEEWEAVCARYAGDDVQA